MNLRGEGEAWERQIMLEGFDPTGVGADFAQPAGLRLRGGNGKRIQHTMVDSGTWFWTGEYDEKGKKIYACNKTGSWSVALEFAGDTEKGEVTEETQSIHASVPAPEPTVILVY